MGITSGMEKRKREIKNKEKLQKNICEDSHQSQNIRERVFCRRASKLRASGCDCVCLCRGREGAGAVLKPADVAGGGPTSFLTGVGRADAVDGPDAPLALLLLSMVDRLDFMLRSRLRTTSVQGLAWLLVEEAPLPTESARTFIQPSLSAALSA